MKTLATPTLIPLLLFVLLLGGCGNGEQSDGYGNFEADEVVVSSEGNGRLALFRIEEGQLLQSGMAAALIDTTQLHFSLRQLHADKAVLLQQLQSVQRDEERYRRLVAEGAAARKQFEGYRDQAMVIRRQITSMEARIGQARDQLQKSVVHNPVGGVVLATYAEEGELASYGKPLYRIARLDSLVLRAYLSAPQLASIAIGDEVAVLVDGKEPAEHQLKGRVTWIASKAEFTPKIIQTREDRVNLVYAVKVTVANPLGLLKIGMPGEIRFLGERR